MTRKRFIKLLMSHGAQRNAAEQYARECIEIVKDYEYLYVFALEELIEQLFKNLEETIEVFKRDCFPDGVPYGFPEFLRKQIQLNAESSIENSFAKESRELKFKETLYRFYGEGEQNERN